MSVWEKALATILITYIVFEVSLLRNPVWMFT